MKRKKQKLSYEIEQDKNRARNIVKSIVFMMGLSSVILLLIRHKIEYIGLCMIFIIIQIVLSQLKDW
jgi:hypothetical protein